MGSSRLEGCARKRGVVGLELDGGGRGPHRGRDEAEGLAGDRVGVRVDGRDGGANRHREVRGELGHGQVVKNDRTEVTRALGRAAERGELLLLRREKNNTYIKSTVLSRKVFVCSNNMAFV